MTFQAELDRDTAIRVAEFLEQNRMPNAAIDTWLGIVAHDPYDFPARRRLGKLVFEQKEHRYRPGSIERSRFVLNLMINTVPTAQLAAAYFENVRRLLEDKPTRDRPGTIVLGLGAGRCGSTTLAGMMAGVPGALATHENPPQIFWEPLEEQLRAALDRLRLLRAYHTVIFDASHWWLNALDRLFAEFPDAKVIGLRRETGACVRSFMKMKRSGPGSLNHWAPAGNGIWLSSPGDPQYPTYPLPTGCETDPDAVKAAQIERYVTEYNEQLRTIADAQPERVILARTEDLSRPDVVARLGEFLNLPLAVPRESLNVGHANDSARPELRF